MTCHRELQHHSHQQKQLEPREEPHESLKLHPQVELHRTCSLLLHSGLIQLGVAGLDLDRESGSLRGEQQNPSESSSQTLTQMVDLRLNDLRDSFLRDAAAAVAAHLVSADGILDSPLLDLDDRADELDAALPPADHPLDMGA